ncbi:hypothetical protein BDR06DRAFT_976173 [Suillus hirtellus]|nr:hypothetical protein BDR06DRAFT_976173 [Suillus hirtellus]
MAPYKDQMAQVCEDDQVTNEMRKEEQITIDEPANYNHDMNVDGFVPWEFDGEMDPAPNQHCGVQVEEVEDEERIWMQFIQSYPGQVAHALGYKEEWGLVKWLVSWVGQNAIDEFMKLPIMSSLKTSFTNKYTLMKAIDQLPHGMEWQLKRISVEGNKLTDDGQHETEKLELWLQDPVDCICKLMADLEFDQLVLYVPERVFADMEGKTRWFDKMWTGDWWWEMQRRLPEGAVVVPVILALDKTSLSQFCGDQEVWPVYLTLGNISKDIQCSRAFGVLNALLDVKTMEI